jgi:hypothetical protein
MKEVSESLQMMRRHQLNATTSVCEKNRYAHIYGASSSGAVPLRETTRGTIDMSELVEDLAR